MDLEKDSVNISIDVDPSKTNAIGQLCQRLLDTQKEIQRIEEEINYFNGFFFGLGSAIPS